MEGYAHFIDRLDDIERMFSLTDEQSSMMYSICDLTMLVFTMLCENDGDTSLTENIMDMLYGDLPEEVANRVIEELSDFHNSGIQPMSMSYLMDVICSDDSINLESVTPVREEGCMIYTFMRHE